MIVERQSDIYLKIYPIQKVSPLLRQSRRFLARMGEKPLDYIALRRDIRHWDSENITKFARDIVIRLADDAELEFEEETL